MVETKHMKGALWFISAPMLALKMFYFICSGFRTTCVAL
uniref:Uncharacterized protein n=1 Tax=Arundo donax TaxID=35708 RepID=A0A0A9HPD2_ARUDO